MTDRVDIPLAAEEAALAKVDYDILIVGSGLVGAALVNCLQPMVQQLGLRVALLDQRAPASSKAVDQEAMLASRPLSLAASSYQLLQRLGLWDDRSLGFSLAESAAPIERVHVSSRAGFGSTLFTAAEQQLPALGYVVPAHLLQQSLALRAQQLAHFEQITELNKVEASEQGVTLTYTDLQGQQQQLRGGLLIGADGAKSQVRDLADFQLQTVSTVAGAASGERMVAVTAAWRGDLGGMAYERFLRAGVLAWLPQAHQRVGMVWVMPEAQALSVQQQTPAAWQEQVSQEMRGYMPPGLVFDRVTGSYPLTTQKVAEPQRDRLWLMGHAAHTFPPLAAQGFNLSLRDVAMFAELLAQQLTPDLSLSLHGVQQLARQYQQARASDVKRTQYLTQLLVESGASRSVISSVTRRLQAAAMLGLSLCRPLKNHLALQLLGQAGPVPRLMRGLDLQLPE